MSTTIRVSHDVVTALSGIGLLTARMVHAQQVPVTAFVHVSVIPMDRERVLRDYTVLVRGDRIVALGPASRVVIPDSAASVDGTGKYLMPGLADMHAHFGMYANFKGLGASWLLNSKVDAADMLFTFVANGVTTVRDMHSGPSADGDHWMLRLRQQIATGELLGPRVYTAGDPVYASPGAAAQSVVALKAAGYDYVKYYSNKGNSIYDSTVAAAQRAGLPFASHAPLPDEGGLPLAFKDRWNSIEHLFGYFEYAEELEGWRSRDSVHSRPVAAATLRRIAQEVKQTGVWTCPTLAYGLWARDVIEREMPAKPTPSVAFYRQLVKALQDAGAGLILGTDAVFSDGSLAWSGFAIHQELEALVAAGLTPYQALATGTTNVARFLGTSDSTGTVAAGKRADLVLLKGNPLADIHNTAALAGVMVGGRWLPRGELEEYGLLGPMNLQIGMLKRAVWR